MTLFPVLRTHPLVRYLREFRDLRASIALGNIAAVIQAVALVPLALLFKRVVDVHIPAQDAVAIAWVAAAGIGLWAVHIAATVASRYYTLSATKTVTERLRARLVGKLQQLSLRFHDSERAADLHSRVVLDTERVDQMANALVVHVLTSVIVATSASVLLAMMNARLFLLLAVMVPLYVVIQRSFAGRLKAGHGGFRADMEKMSGLISDVLHSIRLVKSFAREDFEQARVNERAARVTHRGVRLFTTAALFQILLGFVGGLATLAIFTVGAWMVISGHLTVGEMVAFSALMTYFLTPINTLISMTDQVYAGLAGLESIYGVFDNFEDEATDHLPVPEVTGAVRFEGVGFGYREGRTVLNGIDLDVKPGQQIALVGGSGAGKTTLVNLVMGFYHPTAGRLTIDGTDIGALNLRALRERIGVVSQDNVLLGGTIHDNIRYGRLDATRDEIVEAARMANAHGFIESLPEGYDTEIGDRGLRLSGGQRQRLAIARAVLKDPRILVLDEATSALDSESERAVQDALEHLRRDRTSFIIAHRLSTIQHADVILVLKDGRIVERGTFDELLAHAGEFWRYYRLQFGPEQLSERVSA